MNVEISRKLIHLSSLIYPILYLSLNNKKLLLSISGGLFGLLLILELVRHNYNKYNELYCKYLRPFLRNNEQTAVTGSTFFMFGTFVTILLYPKDLAVLSLFVLVISDTLASIIGLTCGKIKIVSNKTLEGALTFLSSACIISYIASNYLNISLLPALVTSIGITFFELFNKKIRIDDNILIPIGYGFLYILFQQL